MRYAEPVYNGLKKLDGRFAFLVGNRHGLDPLGELVDCDQEVNLSPFRGLWQFADHVEAPLSKSPSYGYGSELGPRCVRFVGEPLASVASSDDVLCVAHGRWPVESCS